VCQRLKDFEDEKGWVGVEREPVQLGRGKKTTKKMLRCFLLVYSKLASQFALHLVNLAKMALSWIIWSARWFSSLTC